MKGYPIVPGVHVAGHMTHSGSWHPGSEAHCPECERPTPIPTEPEPSPWLRPRPNEGSDCVTGKVQFATRDAAQAAARSLRKRHHYPPAPFRCALCDCWHIGNRRGGASKARTR